MRRAFGSRGRRIPAAAILAVMLVAAGCGSTGPGPEPRAALPREGAAEPALTPGEAARPSANGSSAPAVGAPAAVQSAAAAPSQPAPTPPAQKPTKTPVAAAAPAPERASETRSTTGAGGAGPAPAPLPGAPEAPQPAATGAKSEIVLGSFGVQSGVIGSIMLPTHQGARAWVEDVNARGGLAGHPVRLVVGDDGGDPAKAQALVRRMVDQDKVVAFYAEHAPTTIQAALPFLEERRIPILGGCNCSPLTARSPMAFQVGTGSDYGLVYSHAVPLLSYSDKRKVSVLYCREAPVCVNVYERLQEVASGLGLSIVHEAQVSLVQPDYTAEVLAARNAGAEAFIAIIDNFSIGRLARTAHRQGWSPPIAGQYSAHDDRYPKESGEDVEGTLIGGGMPSWESPKLADYRAALNRYVPGGVKATIGINAWAAGKLMERIAPSFPDRPTSADFLRGLYALRGETLGGLIPPLTFREGRGTENLCIVPFKVEKGRFIPKDGDNFVCPPQSAG